MPRIKKSLEFVKRLGRGRYIRRWVTDPKKKERGERLYQQYKKEAEEMWRDPVLYAHIAWTSKSQLNQGEVKIRLKGLYWTWSHIQRDARAFLKKYAGTIPHYRTVMMPSPESPGLYYLTIKEEPHKIKFKYYYDPEKTARPGTGLGRGIKDLRGW